MQVIGNIEVLPNEVLLECFKYLNGVDFLYSFNQLNFRFNQLIESIPLHLDFQNIEKSVFHMFCHKVLSNEKIGRQIYSLNLSNKFTCNQILLFLGFFSFNEFPQLQSLSLIEVKSYDVLPLKLRLPVIGQLRRFRLDDTSNEGEKLLSILPSSQLRHLELSTLPSDLRLIKQFSSLINIRISGCSPPSLCNLLSTITHVKYLKVDDVHVHVDSTFDRHMIREWGKSAYENVSTNPSMNLQHLIIKFTDHYDKLKMILERTPNLINLTLSMNASYINKTNINQLEQWITSLLPYLKIFKFTIQGSSRSVDDAIQETIKEFQCDFWSQEHNCYTRCSVFGHDASIYIIPFICDS